MAQQKAHLYKPRENTVWTLGNVLVDALWIIGLAGVLSVFSYMGWYRGLQRWTWAQTLRRPRLLFPLSLCLTMVCAGLALNGVFAYQQAPLWESIAWGLLSLLFLLQTLIYGVAGYKQGWDTSIEGTRQ